MHSAENDLLILAARPSLNPEAASRLRSLIRETTNWQHVLETAQEHAIPPLLYHHFRSECVDEVPADVMLQLRDLNEANTNHAFRLLAELVKLLDLFKEHGIDAIPFKGPTLSLLAFGDVALRQFADVDILIRAEHMAPAGRLLSANGFLPTPRLDGGQEAALLRFDCAQNFCNQQNVTVDLHWNFAPKYLGIAVDLHTLRGRLQPIHFGQRKMTTLAQEDLLLVLSIHGFTHNWQRLGWISDIAGLIERNTTSWELLLRNARRLGLQRILSVGLLLASKLLEAGIPRTALTEIERDAAAVELADRYALRILNPREDARLFESPLIHLRMRERLPDKIFGGVRLLLVPRAFDWLFLSIPASLSFLYYLVRPGRLVWKHVKEFNRGRPHQPGLPEHVRVAIYGLQKCWQSL